MIGTALTYYQFGDPKVEFIRHNENMTYKVTDGGRAYLLRIHKPSDGFDLGLLRAGVSGAELIADEIRILRRLEAQGNARTQKVMLNAKGEGVTVLGDGTPATVLEWVDGETLESVEITAGIARGLGVMIGELHNRLRGCDVENRYRYDGALLSRMETEAAEAAARGHFNERCAKTVSETLSYIGAYLTEASGRFTLIHADLSKSNLIYQNGTIVPIDFSMCGYCVPEMDLGSVFTHINDGALNAEVLRGYESAVDFEPDKAGIDVCFSLQILLFIVAQHNRFASEPWFRDKLNEWCDEYFIPLTGGTQ